MYRLQKGEFCYEKVKKLKNDGYSAMFPSDFCLLSTKTRYWYNMPIADAATWTFSQVNANTTQSKHDKGVKMMDFKALLQEKYVYIYNQGKTNDNFYAAISIYIMNNKSLLGKEP